MNRDLKFRAWIPTDVDDNDEYSHFVMAHEFAFGQYLHLNNLLANYPHPIMQYTGLKDKAGVEIYEGDILSDGYRNRQVRWQETIAGWAMSFAKGGTISIDKDIEVVGNIYEHPHLLETTIK